MNNPSSPYLRLRTFARNRVLDLLGCMAKPAPGIHLLNGHRITDEPEPATFRQLLKDLSKYVTFIRVEDAVQRICRRETPDKPLVAFTFDDGFMECYDVFAPVLEEWNTNALFFINPNYVEGDEQYIEHFNNETVMTAARRPMRWAQIKELAARGHIIGAHTMDHYMINSDDEATVRYQITTCQSLIAEHTGQPCDYFAFPYGRLSQANEKSIEIACATYPYVFSQSDYKNYFSFGGKVINRRHFEPFWPKRHVFYFLSAHKSY